MTTEPTWQQDDDDRDDGYWWLRRHDGEAMACVHPKAEQFRWFVISQWDSDTIDEGDEPDEETAKRAALASAVRCWR